MQVDRQTSGNSTPGGARIVSRDPLSLEIQSATPPSRDPDTGSGYNARRMHILYIHQYFATPRGGTGTRSYEFARRWVRAGHRVTMLTS